MRRASLFVAAAALVAAACSSSSSTSPSSPDSPSSSSPPSSSSGRVFVRLSAGSFSQAKAILATFTRVRLYRGSPTLFNDVALSSGTGQYTCDLKKLTSDVEIAVGTIPAAAYSQVGLVLQSMTVYIDSPTGGAPCAASMPAPGGRSAPLTVPTAEIALPRNFDVKAAADTILRLDFNTDQSIKVTGDNSFSFTPVFSVVSVTSSS